MSENWKERAIAAVAKLAMVKEELLFQDNLDLESYTEDDVENMNEANLRAWEIVKDIRPPLAVVETTTHWDDDMIVHVAVDVPGVPVMTPVTVIVLPREDHESNP